MLPKFCYLRPDTLDEAIGLLNDHGAGARVFAGGTDLLIGMHDGTHAPECVVDIKGITQLRTIGFTEVGSLIIGACVTVNELIESDTTAGGLQAIRDAASVLATYQIRNRATVGGNLCNASPACDLGPPLLVLGAELRLVSRRGERLVPLKDFFGGVKATCCDTGEVVTEVVIPAQPGTVSAFLKRGRIKGHYLAVVNAAGALGSDGDLRLALGAVGTTPLLIDGLGGTSVNDKHKVVDTVLGSIAPIDDVRGSSIYRKHMAEFLTGEILDLLKRRLKRGGA
jgi:CO/xanthine dehydrogenase FAD-binding subunit